MDDEDTRIVKLNPVETPKKKFVLPPPKSPKKRKPYKKSEKQRLHLEKARARKSQLNRQQKVIDAVREKVLKNGLTSEKDLLKMFKDDDEYQLETPGAEQTVVDTRPDDAPTEAPIGRGRLPEQPSNLQVYKEDYKEVSLEEVNPNDVFIQMTPSEKPYIYHKSVDSWLDRF